jgi:type I restriction enzyme M protein
VLEEDGIKFASLDEGFEYIEAVKDAAVKELGYFLKPSELFHAIAMKGNNQADTEIVNVVVASTVEAYAIFLV